MNCKLKYYTIGIIIVLFTHLDVHAFVGGVHWDSEAAAAGVEPTGTLPVMYIDTENGQIIDQKEYYIPGKYHFDADGFQGYQSAGTADEPLEIEIRGRGNSTWKNFDKKPYKIKLGKKAALLDTKKNKHYALLHFVGGYTTYFAHPLGLEIGQYIMTGWTPRVLPIELVLNGQYIGLYFLAESVRIDDGRVEIEEQDPENEDADKIDGGYLVEIDNYDDANQITFDEYGKRVRITAKTPDPMNPMHEDYLLQQFEAITAELYNTDKLSREWEDMIDMDSYARHYVVQEIIHNWDAYNGSCYLYKDFGSKWTFGPLWDLGDSMDQFDGDYVYNQTPYAKTWIRQTVQFPRFMKKVQQIWREFKTIDPQTWTDFLLSWNDRIAQAEIQNQKVWDYYRGGVTSSKMTRAQNCLNTKIAWLDEQWGSGNLTCNVRVESIISDCNEENNADMDSETESDNITQPQILLGGHEYTDVDVFKGSDLEITFVLNRDQKISCLYVNDEDFTDKVSGNKMILSDIQSDSTIKVEYERASLDEVKADSGTDWKIDGNIVSADKTISVYTVSGQLVSTGEKVTIPLSGIYILISKSGDVSKILVK